MVSFKYHHFTLSIGALVALKMSFDPGLSKETILLKDTIKHHQSPDGQSEVLIHGSLL